MTKPDFNLLSMNVLGDTPAEKKGEPEAAPAKGSGDEKVYDVIIVGSGPSGYTAALYAARAELSPLVFEGYEFGGELMNTTEVENFPGFEDGIMGPELMSSMRAQAERFGAELRPELVERVDFSGDVKKVYVDGEEFKAHAIILATGAAPRHLGIPGEEELTGRGVSTCATCDGFFFKDHHIAVVGGGDSAMEEATFLTTFGSKVSIIHRSENFRASQIMLDRARDNEKIEFITNTVVDEVQEADGKVSGLKVRNTQTGEESVLDATALFVAIGHDPRSAFLEGQVAIDEGGYIQVEDPTTKTSVPGVFAAGDVVDHIYRQAITAAGSGCRAAIDAQHYLNTL
ncbi:thioredoxin-disulfide reductase [Corynebacterium godavarianum]|uniref:Thioredoxin reductase n=1 Tax=Corynebacterium godavarianum TaxID=2054421 RepID=A0ABY3DYI6_9CORY|nr:MULTISPECIES: thioredoxin-disulfide reductase [Corynebacterium]MBL7284765.1 thioredoxin-disulfide reductase [Corynebacterium godavarianum]MCG7254637.1 thioredoxin-disulfide reductase [Corynebacterium hadale]MCG7256792.1 thioredoxin-disulfide reductase [Corynebacterium hadale]MCG7265477.1 thioredoxin-disulfide reductase [Corynebacterium hadale]TSJ71199.1 thioredoxin-disulfide reductase [Corynebacterium godavarianum]